jgi:hypothetical protein
MHVGRDVGVGRGAVGWSAGCEVYHSLQSDRYIDFRTIICKKFSDDKQINGQYIEETANIPFIQGTAFDIDKFPCHPIRIVLNSH